MDKIQNNAPQEKLLMDYAVGESFSQCFLIKNAMPAITKAGKDYLKLTLQDRSGDVSGNLWDVTAEQKGTLVNGVVVAVNGDMDEYNGAKQVNFKQITLASDVPVDAFLRVAPIPKEDMFTVLIDYYNQIQNVNLKNIIRELVGPRQEALKNFPAAQSVHHDYVSGLLHHTTTMLKLADAIAMIYQDVNRDLLIAGIIAHDLGKTDELTGVMATEYTRKGSMLGHIAIVHAEIEKIAERLGIADSEEVMLLQHIVLSHHGKGEWGSPVPPKILEALIIHQIDKIDANINAITKALEHVEPKEESDKIWSLENRKFYQHHLDKG